MSRPCSYTSYLFGTSIQWLSDAKAERLTSVARIYQEFDAIVNEVRKEDSTVMHSIALHGKGLVDLHVARLELEVGVDTKSRFVLRLVHPGVDPLHLLIAEVAILRLVTGSSHVVRIKTSFCWYCE